MKLKEAIETFRKEKQDKKYILIQLSFTEYILPFDIGITLLKALSEAESYSNEYSKGTFITPLDTKKLEFSIVSETTYTRIKLANLLKVNSNDFDPKTYSDSGDSIELHEAA